MSLAMISILTRRFPSHADAIRLFAFKISTPMLAWTAPKIVSVTSTESIFRVPLNLRTKNGWNSMFFAAIATGIDLTGGWYSFAAAEEHNVGVLYKDVAIQFKRRVDGDLTLVTRNNKTVNESCLEAAKTGLRINVPVEIEGYCYDTYSDVKPVVTAQATLSMKVLK